MESKIPYHQSPHGSGLGELASEGRGSVEGNRGPGKRQPGATTLRCSSHLFLLQIGALMNEQKSQGDPGKPCLKLQDVLNKHLPPEIH